LLLFEATKIAIFEGFRAK